MDIVLRTAAGYLFITFILRIIGRRELSTLGASDVVLLLGGLIQNGWTWTRSPKKHAETGSTRSTR